MCGFTGQSYRRRRTWTAPIFTGRAELRTCNCSQRSDSKSKHSNSFTPSRQVKRDQAKNWLSSQAVLAGSCDSCTMASTTVPAGASIVKRGQPTTCSRQFEGDPDAFTGRRRAQFPGFHHRGVSPPPRARCESCRGCATRTNPPAGGAIRRGPIRPARMAGTARFPARRDLAQAQRTARRDRRGRPCHRSRTAAHPAAAGLSAGVSLTHAREATGRRGESRPGPNPRGAGARRTLPAARAGTSVWACRACARGRDRSATDRRSTTTRRLAAGQIDRRDGRAGPVCRRAMCRRRVP
jgi:hypothetical protein